jgi:thioredoxin 1
MGPYIDKLAQEYNGRLKVLKINTQDNTEVPARYGITAIPTFLLLKKGEVVKQMVGSQPYDALKKVVEAALN